RPGGDELRPAPRAGEDEGLHVPLDEIGEQRGGLAGGRAAQRLLATALPVLVGALVLLAVVRVAARFLPPRRVAAAVHAGARARLPQPDREPGPGRAVLGDRLDITTDQPRGGQLRVRGGGGGEHEG